MGRERGGVGRGGDNGFRREERTGRGVEHGSGRPSTGAARALLAAAARKGKERRPAGGPHMP
jgi:hypothetical protein